MTFIYLGSTDGTIGTYHVWFGGGMENNIGATIWDLGLLIYSSNAGSRLTWEFGSSLNPKLYTA